jgi:hypothetical protein
MSTWTPIDRRVGLYSAVAIVLISAVYILTGAIWLLSNLSVAQAEGLEPREPYLAILETLILLFAPALIALFAAIHSYAPADKKTCGLAAFGFAVSLACTTGVIHFVQLTAVRRIQNRTIAEAFAFYDPSGRLMPMLAADLAVWDFFLGFGLLFAATIFKGDKLQGAIRTSMIIAGALCLIGVSGPASSDMRFQIPAIFGYAFVFPFVCLLLAVLFARSEKFVR